MNSGLHGFPQPGVIFPIIMGGTNEASLDAQIYLTGQRLGAVSGTAANASLKAVVPFDCMALQACYSNRTANFFSGEDVLFQLNRYTRNPAVIQSRHFLYNGPINGATGYQTMQWYSQPLEIVLGKFEGLDFSWIATWATNPSQMDHTLTLWCKTI